LRQAKRSDERCQDRAPEGHWRPRLRRLLLVSVLALYAISIPWYRQGGEVPEIVLGVPDWFALALGCYAGVALLNAIAWLITDIEDPVAEEKPGR
jgi:hypothetical protein